MLLSQQTFTVKWDTQVVVEPGRSHTYIYIYLIMSDVTMPHPMKTLSACPLAQHAGLCCLPLEGNHPASPSEYPECNQHMECMAYMYTRDKKKNKESSGHIIHHQTLLA